MDGKTHAAIGATSALLIVQPKAPVDLAITVDVGAFAGILPDIDSEKSEVSKVMKKVVTVFVAVMAVLVIQSSFTGLSVTQRLNSSGLGASMVGLAILIAFCAYGSTQPHRGFTHSFVALIAMSLNAYFLFSGFLLAFIIGYVSHLAIDFPNKRGEQLLWPLHGRYCLGLCSSNGVAALYTRLAAYAFAVGYAWSLSWGEIAVSYIRQILR